MIHIFPCIGIAQIRLSVSGHTLRSGLSYKLPLFQLWPPGRAVCWPVSDMIALVSSQCNVSFVSFSIPGQKYEGLFLSMGRKIGGCDQIQRAQFCLIVFGKIPDFSPDHVSEMLFYNRSKTDTK